MTRLPALVLTAGLGTRMRPLTYLRAKAAVPVNGEPLAVRAARWLAGYGLNDQVFNLHHHPHTIASALGDGSHLGIRVRYSWEQPVLGSAGGPRHALPLLTDGGHERFLIVNGDTLTNVDLEAVLATHERSGALVTMALINNPAPDKYGGVSVGDDGFVTRFTARGVVRDSYHFIGVQVVEAEVFAALEDGVPSESVGSLYPALMKADPRSVAAYVSESTFQDIGTPADCLDTSLALVTQEGDRLIAPSAQIAQTAMLRDTAVWDDVKIGHDARLTHCIIGDGVSIPDGASYERCAIVPASAHEPSAEDRVEGDLLIRTL